MEEIQNDLDHVSATYNIYSYKLSGVSCEDSLEKAKWVGLKDKEILKAIVDEYNSHEMQARREREATRDRLGSYLE